jgi:ActR/RegA family two-component response regulator
VNHGANPNATVLIVDDERVISDTLARSLLSMDTEVLLLITGGLGYNVPAS